MDASVIICTYNRSDSLRKTFLSLETMSISPGLSWELIVVDNNSSDATKTVVTEYQRRYNLPIQYLFEGKQGLSHARNAGLRVAQGNIIAFTDDDCIVHEAWLTSIKKTFDSFQCAAVGGKIVPKWSVDRPEWFDIDGPRRLMAAIVYFDHGNVSKIIETAPFGANMAFRKCVFEKYGFFRVDLGPNGSGSTRVGGGGDDTEFCRRLLDKGEMIVYSPETVVYHPVEEERTKRKYFESWYFKYGKSLVLAAGISKDVVCYLGIPRYMVRKVITKFLGWVFTMDRKQRFGAKLEFYETVGQIAGSLEVLRENRHSGRTSSSL